jgi:hypothetical protein
MILLDIFYVIDYFISLFGLNIIGKRSMSVTDQRTLSLQSPFDTSSYRGQGLAAHGPE